MLLLFISGTLTGQAQIVVSEGFALAARAGFVTVVTARDGNVFHQHRDDVMSLPRRGLCRSKEEIAFPGLVISGAPVALGSRLRNPIVSV